jgi:small-conductance mechanosensitive channel
MGVSNPIEVIIVITFLVLVATAAVAIVAPSLGITVPDPPIFPTLEESNYAGNVSATWAFVESHPVIAFSTVKYAAFNPDKHVNVVHQGFTGQGYQVERWSPWWIIPNWIAEPVSTTSHVKIPSIPTIGTPSTIISTTLIISTYDGRNATFIVDDGNKQYMCYIAFSPLPGATTMQDSWNRLHGFNVLLYGNAYSPPSWTDQLAADLVFLGSLIAYCVYFIGYIIGMSSLLFELLGFSPVLAGGVVMLIFIAFIGSILMFFRGNSNK